LGKPTTTLLVVYFICLIIFFICIERGFFQLKVLATLLFLPFLCQLFLVKYHPAGEVTFLDVGQGDSIFIRLPFNQGNYLIDTGGSISFQTEEWKKRSREFEPGRSIVLPFLKSKGIRKLDKLILTHGDYDHIGGAFTI